jgi:hypothetical protein
MSQMKPENPEDRRKAAEVKEKLDATREDAKQTYEATLVDITKYVEAAIASQQAAGTEKQKAHLEDILRVIRDKRARTVSLLGDL